MKLSFVLAIALFSGSIPLAAQQGSAGAAGGGVFRIGSDNSTQPAQQSPPAPSLCPAVLTAQYLSGGSMIRTGIRAGLTHPKGIGQWLQINLMPRSDKARATGATLAVHGFSKKGRITQTDGKGGPDAVRTVSVSLAPAPNGQVAGVFWAPGLTAVSSIDLISLAYSDGGSWNAAKGQACSVTPDRLMLITAR